MAKTARNGSARATAAEVDSDGTNSGNDGDLNRRRIVWVLCAALFVCLFASLASFRSTDWPTHVVASPTDPPLNLCGRFGAVVSYWLYSTLGFGLWIPVVYLGIVLWATALGREIAHPFVRFVGCLIAMCSFGALHAEWFPTVGPLTGVDAGLVPMFFADEMHARFGPVGASIAFLTAFALGAIVAADKLVAMLPGAIKRSLGFLAPVWETDWKSHLAALRERFSAMFPQPAVAGAGRGSKARRSTARPAVAVAKPVEIDEIDADDSEEDADDDLVGEDNTGELDESDDSDCDEESDEQDDFSTSTPTSTSTSTSTIAMTETKPAAETGDGRAPLSEAELRAKIEKLPIKMT
ncbi:MAG: DNA translocase FtsK 4TM domain-containing protein, partial [Limnohabitans sp.]|nr:DNA translocase FtsK 4TM domain-containing protein [Limnohabitans sp.]